MLDWNQVIENSELLKKVEDLVDEAGEINFDFPQNLCDELNQLTGNSWDGDQYIEYCAEYWESPWGLEETVYALFHDGEFPDMIEKELHIFRPLEEMDLPRLTIGHNLCKSSLDGEFRAKFEALPKEKILQWLRQYFSDWEESKLKESEDVITSYGVEYGKSSYFYKYVKERKYGYEKYIGISLSNDKSGFIWSKNLIEKEWNDVLDFFKNEGGYALYEK